MMLKLSKFRSCIKFQSKVNSGVRVNCLCPCFTDTDMIRLDDKPGAVSNVEDFRKIEKDFPFLK